MSNRLAQESSPYLLQHRDNPVDWYPWGAEALERARAEDKPLLVSIGYSACHWCHVMAHESFENATTAELMNTHFINVKVDREERPDIDSIYMSAIQAMTGAGGWPLNVFLTPDGVPFFGGTYWPPRDHRNVAGFPAVLTAVATSWRDNRESIVSGATRIRAFLEQSSSAVADPGAVDATVTDRALDALERQFDEGHGGFGGAPKFPQASVLEFLLRHHARTGSSRALNMLATSLDHMAAGGIYDHLGGGFARYAVDDIWLVPHFEKMLYDNAQLVGIYVDAWKVTGTDQYRTVVEETIAWMLREMHSADGGFYSALDADSEGVEGKFYVWTSEEIDGVLDTGSADLVKLAYGVTPQGNFEGHNILFVRRSAESLAEAGGSPIDDVGERLDQARASLLRTRDERVRPGTDDKVVIAWNGMAISALARAGAAFDRPDWIAAAREAATLILEHCLDDGRLPRTWKAGTRRGEGTLEDYAAVAECLIHLYTVTAEERWLAAADGLVDVVIAHFPHDSGVGFYDVADTHEHLVVRPRDLQDGATPSGTATIADVLLSIAAYRQDDALSRIVEKILAMQVDILARHPTAFGRFLAVLERWLMGTQELVFVASADLEATNDLVHLTLRSYVPATVIGYVVGGTSAWPMMLDRPLPAGSENAAYACRNRVCLPPVTSPDDLARLLATAFSGFH